MIGLDASVLVKLVTQEDGSEEAAAYVAQEAERLAPDWFIHEVASALSQKMRFGGLPVDQAAGALNAVSIFLTDVIDTEPLFTKSLMLSTELQHAFYDCVYLAVAIDSECKLVTADAKFAKAAAAGGYGDHVQLLIDR